MKNLGEFKVIKRKAELSLLAEAGRRKAYTILVYSISSYISIKYIYILTNIPDWRILVENGFRRVRVLVHCVRGRNSSLIKITLGGVKVYFSSASAEARRYARGINRVMSGIWGRELSKFRECTLTTREGDDNTWYRMRKDIAKLIARLKTRGIVVEYCFSPEVSPKSGLLHVHGFIYMRKGSIELYELQALWKDIHGASQVTMKEARSHKAVCKYMVKHMLKEYVEDIGFKGKLLLSRKWLPLGWKQVREHLVKWAMDRVYSFGEGIWAIMNKMYEDWCKGETIMLVRGNQKYFIRRVRREAV